jgi:CheY-like chemotaxis protein
MTANAIKGDREKCFDAGMNDYISKSAKISEICKVLQKWLTAEPVAPKEDPRKAA